MGREARNREPGEKLKRKGCKTRARRMRGVEGESEETAKAPIKWEGTSEGETFNICYVKLERLRAPVRISFW